MSFDASEYIRKRMSNEELLRDAGIYDPSWEHDNCGVGLVAAINGRPSRAVVEAAISLKDIGLVLAPICPYSEFAVIL